MKKTLTDGTIYRRAKPGDIQAITQFQIAMAEETEQLKLDERICMDGVTAVFAQPLLGQYFVGETNGAVICSVLITYEWSDWRNGLVWWIQSVYVIPELRRQGIYTGLYAYIKELAEADKGV